MAEVPTLQSHWAKATGQEGSVCGISAPCGPESPGRAFACTPGGISRKRGNQKVPIFLVFQYQE